MSAAGYRLNHLTAIVDRNRAMIDGMTEDVMPLEPFADKWRAFGWQVIEVDGHDIPALVDAFASANAHTDGPSVVIANTVKGQGIDFIAGDYKWHYGSFGGEKADEARAALDDYYQQRLAKVERS